MWLNLGSLTGCSQDDRAVIVSRLNWGGSISKLIHMLLAGFHSSQVVGLRPHFHPGYWLEASLSYLPHGPLHRATHNMAACFRGNE